MRRDVCYYFATDVKSLYNAYLSAAKNQQFRRDCREEPYHTITFGLNYSMKYNMNGGSCTLHFIPYQGGSAIDLRFSIAQAFGARYEAYAQELTNAACGVLGICAQSIQLNIELFTDASNRVLPQAAAAMPAPTPSPAQKSQFCTNCGSALAANDAFCSNCGTRVAPKNKFCTQCGKPVSIGAAFCSNCGSKL